MHNATPGHAAEGLVTFSSGAVVAETPPASFEALVKDADQLMYTVKKSGKNRLVLEARTE